MHIIEKKRDLIKDLDKAMFNLRWKDNAKTTVNKNMEEQEEEWTRRESSPIFSNVKKLQNIEKAIKGL